MEQNKSDAERLAELSQEEQDEVLDEYTDEELEALNTDWEFWARKNQLIKNIVDKQWYVWLILAGRGWGKTRTGAETVTEWIEDGYKRIALVGQTKKDVRDVMIDGESGLIACAKPWNRPRLIYNRGVLIYPNGAVCFIYSDEAPEALRGPQFEKSWVDELAKFKSLGDPEKSAWENLEMGMRLGDNPQVIVTTTPKNKKVIKELIKDAMTTVTRGATYENIKNLASSFVRRIVNKYEGTRLARQELYAEVLEDVEGALWNLDMIEKHRIVDYEGQESMLPEFVRIVVGADPAVTNNAGSDETGIIVAALGTDGHGYILDDVSIKASVNGWAKEIVKAYHDNEADLIIGEVNNGGDLIEMNIRLVDDTVAYKAVHASRGKQTRAEPVVNLYEQGRIHHYGMLPKAEDEMTSWVPGQGKSPNRVDALVWAITELMLNSTYDPDRFEMS